MKKTIIILWLVAAASCIFAAGLTFDPFTLYTQKEALKTTPHTYEAWIKLPKDFAPRGGIIAGNYGITAAINFEISSGGAPRLYIDGTRKNSGVGLNADIQFREVNAASGRWTHVAVILNEKEGRADCYINGKLAQTLKEASLNTSAGPISDFTERPPLLPLVIGSDRRIGSPMYFKGAIRSVAEFADVRTPLEIKQDMYDLDTKDKDLLFYYSFKYNQENDVIEDLAGNYPLYHEPNPYVIKDEDRWVEEKDLDNSQIAWSMAFLGDTQVVNDLYPEKLHLLYDWILEKKDYYKIKYVMGLGDITNRDLPREWELAREQYERLNGVIPWGVVKGNHDSPKRYNETFGYDAYRASCDGFYEENLVENSYRFLTVGQNKYIIFTLEYGPRDEVLEWAGKVIDAHPECKAIITTHCYLFRDGTTLDQNDVCPPATTGGHNNGDHMWDKFVRKHKNIWFVINGHDPFDMVVTAQEKGDAGNLVTQMLIDPQGTDANMKGACLVCILGFSEDGKKAFVRYWSADQKKYYLKNNQYEIDLE